jgi:hypothetical protein
MGESNTYKDTLNGEAKLVVESGSVTYALDSFKNGRGRRIKDGRLKSRLQLVIDEVFHQ